MPNVVGFARKSPRMNKKREMKTNLAKIKKTQERSINIDSARTKEPIISAEAGVLIFLL